MAKTTKIATLKKATPANADVWVSQSGNDVSESPRAIASKSVPAEPMKRFTIDVNESLHKRIKAECAMRGVKMADVVRELLEREFPI